MPPEDFGRFSELLYCHDGSVRANIFAIFVSIWYPRWLESLSTFPIIPGQRFGMLYLPPGGLRRSSQSFFRHDGGVGANHFYDFCIFLRPNGTPGGWKVS